MAKATLKTYAVGITTDECYAAVFSVRKGAVLKAIAAVKGFVGVHPGPRVQCFLFLTPEAQKQAYKIAKRNFKTAMLIKNTAFVPLGDVAVPEVQRNDADD